MTGFPALSVPPLLLRPAAPLPPPLLLSSALPLLLDSGKLLLLLNLLKLPNLLEHRVLKGEMPIMYMLQAGVPLPGVFTRKAWADMHMLDWIFLQVRGGLFLLLLIWVKGLLVGKVVGSRARYKRTSQALNKEYRPESRRLRPLVLLTVGLHGMHSFTDSPPLPLHLLLLPGVFQDPRRTPSPECAARSVPLQLAPPPCLRCHSMHLTLSTLIFIVMPQLPADLSAVSSSPVSRTGTVTGTVPARLSLAVQPQSVRSLLQPWHLRTVISF